MSEPQQNNQQGSEQNQQPQAFGQQAPDVNSQQYQQSFQAQQQQQQWAPSAYSAPVPGNYQPQYGQPGLMPARPSAFGGLFSLDFNRKYGAGLARLMQLLAVIVAAVLVVFGFFELIGDFMGADFISEFGGSGAMQVIVGLFQFAFRVVAALLLLAGTRALGEILVKNSEDNK